MGDLEEHQSTVSMPEARRIDTTPPTIVRAEDIPAMRHTWPSGVLRCAHCDAVVHPVYSPPKEKSRPQRPYFRRKPLRGRGNQHDEQCVYNIDERIRVIRADSGGALVRERSAGPPRYRLVVPEAFGPANGNESAGGGLSVAERLTQVLNTAAKIAALLEDYASRGAEVNTEWSAECRGERVEWLNFLYVPQRIWVLRNRLSEPETTLTHPTAVIFLAQEPRRRRTPLRDGTMWDYRAARYAVPPDPGQPKSEKLFVGGSEDVVGEAFSAGLNKYYLGYGMWSRFSYAEQFPPRLTLRLHHTTQLVQVREEFSRGAFARWRDWRRLHE